MTSTAQHSVSRLITVWLVALAMIVAPCALTPEAWADTPQEQARKHYEAGRDLYTAGDYRGAIREFETAGRLAPSPVLDFNIGLAYERLGDLDKALAHYKAYINAMPNAVNRAAVDAKIQALQKELAERSATTTTTTEIPDPGTAAGRVVESGGDTDVGADTSTTGDPAVIGDSSVTGTVSGTDTHASSGISPPTASVYEPTGDPMLDRVAAVDMAQLRTERAVLASASATAETADATPVDAAVDQGEKPKKRKPIYKQWWFWVVTGFSALILINMARGSDSANATRDVPNGAVLIRF